MSYERFLWAIDIIACWTLSLGSVIFLIANRVDTWRQLILSAGLVLVCVGTFVGAAVIWETGHRAEWAVGQRVGSACVMLWMYDRKFAEDGVGGVNRHIVLSWRWLIGLPKRWAESLERWIAS